MFSRAFLSLTLFVVLSSVIACRASHADDSATACVAPHATSPAIETWPEDPTMLRPAPAPSSSVFVPAQHAPHPALPNHGYRAPSSIGLEFITTPNDPLADELHQFAQALATSQWWKDVGADYGLPPTIDHVVSTIGPAIDKDVDASALHRYVHDATGAAPDALDGSAFTIRIVFLPPGIRYVLPSGTNCGCSELLAAHEYSHYREVVGFVQRCATAEDGALDFLTKGAAHEVIEAATDPYGAANFPGYYLAADKAAPWNAPPLAFSSGEAVVEVGDLCNATRYEGRWAFLSVWSNSKATKGEAPCIPYASSEAYFHTTTNAPWTAMAAGETVSMPVDGWSSGPRADWYVQVGSYTPHDSEFRAEVTTAKSEALGSHTYHAINNGESGTLTITAPNAASGTWVIVTVVSRSVVPSVSRSWRVGAYIR